MTKIPALLLTLIGVTGLLIGCTAQAPNTSTPTQPGVVMTMANGQVMTMAPGETDTTVPTGVVTGNEGTPTDITQAFLTYAKANFGGSSTWIPVVVSVSNINAIDKAYVNDSANAGPICAALSNFQLTNNHQFTGVQVIDTKGAVLVNRVTSAQGC